MWNEKELKEKLKYLTELSKNIKDKDKKYLVLCDKAIIVQMLELLKGNRLKINTSLLIVTNKLSLKKAAKEYSSYQITDFDRFSKDLEFAFYLCKNIARISPLEEVEGTSLIDKEECFAEIINFANSLQDEQLRNSIISTLSDKDKLYITTKNLPNNYNGVNFGLSTFKECYIASPPLPTILLHEIIHSIDAKMSGSKTNLYPFSYEVPAYSLQFYKNMRIGNFNNLNGLIGFCKNNLAILFKKNPVLLNNKEIERLNFSDILVKNDTAFENLLTIKSTLIACIFAKKLLDDEVNGLKDYKEMLRTRFSIDTTPDYSKWAITDDVIIDYSKNLTNYFSKYTRNKRTGGKRK